jgi:hypothetical protein
MLIFSDTRTKPPKHDKSIPSANTDMSISRNLSNISNVLTKTQNIDLTNTTTNNTKINGNLDVTSNITATGAVNAPNISIISNQISANTSSISTLQDKTSMITDNNLGTFTVTGNSATFNIIPRGVPYMNPNPSHSYLYGGITVSGAVDGAADPVTYPLIGWGSYTGGGHTSGAPIKFLCRELTMIEIDSRNTPKIQMYENVICNKTLTAETNATINGNLTVGGQIQSSSKTLVLSPLPSGDGSVGVVESYGVLKVIDDDGFKTTLILKAADGLGQALDNSALEQSFKYTSLMVKDKYGEVFPWLTVENEGGGGAQRGRTSIYSHNDLIMRLSSANGVQAFYPVKCSNTTPSISTTTGSIITNGGVGIAGDINLGGKINGLSPTGGVFSQITTTRNSGSTEQTLISTGIGNLTIPAGTFKQGDAYCLKLGGIKTNSNNDTIEIKLKSGATILGSTGSIQLPALLAKPYAVEFNFTIIQLGIVGSGSIQSNGFLSYTNSGTYHRVNFTGLNPINTTIDNTLDIVSVQSHTDNNNIITCESLILSKIY